MSRPQSRVTSEIANMTNHHILGPGGYFDSQTTDTQFFWPITDGLDPAVPTDRDPTINTTSPIVLEPSDRRSHGPPEKWCRLDQFINGPEYANGHLWTTFPVLKRHRPDVDHPAQALKWTYKNISRKEIELVDNFCFNFQALAGASKPHNAIQGELVFITMLFARVLPFMARTAMDSDLVRMRDLISVSRDLLRAMEVLVDVEDEARERLNGEIDKEIAELVDGV